MADEEVVDQQPETEEQKKDKISKKYAEAMTFVTKLVGGEERLKPARTVKGDVAARVVAKLFKQEQTELEQKALDGLKDLLKKYVEFQADISKRRKELEQIELQKKKEFTAEVNKLRQTIDQQGVMAQSYADALKVAVEEESTNK